MMSQTQYKTLMSNLLNKKHTLTKLRAELEGRREKLYRYCKGLRRVEKEKAACMVKPQEVQQEWRKSSVAELRKKAEEHCGKRVPEKALLLELG